LRRIEISAAYKRLVAFKASLDTLVVDLFPQLSGATDIEAFGDELRNLKSKEELQRGEVKRITAQVDRAFSLSLLHPLLPS
jgi:hypothetical protein